MQGEGIDDLKTHLEIERSFINQVERQNSTHSFQPAVMSYELNIWIRIF